MMSFGFNTTYFLTNTHIPDSKPVYASEPVICPQCEKIDKGAEGYEGVTKCLECGMLYWIRRKDNEL